MNRFYEPLAVINKLIELLFHHTQTTYLSDLHCRFSESKGIWLERQQPGSVWIWHRETGQKYVLIRPWSDTEKQVKSMY
jgi:hypothetical protein